MFGALKKQAINMTKASAAPKSFEAAITELERIVGDMEASSISLEQGLDQYQRGVKLLQYCRIALSTAEQRLLRLEGDALTEAPSDNSGEA